MNAISDNLIHFLGRRFKDSPNKQFEVFKSIIKNGLKCSNINIKFGQSGSIHNKVVCFTDLPLSCCDDHTAIYGKFGIGFKKSFVKNNGGNPARYFLDSYPMETLDETHIENRGMLYVGLCNHFKLILYLKNQLDSNPELSIHDKEGKEILNKNQLKNWVGEQIAIFSFEKEMGDLGSARDETKDIDLYYKEREWRLVPFQANFISGSIKKDEKGCLFYKFKRDDVNVILVPNEEIRNNISNFFKELIVSEDANEQSFGKNPPPIISYDALLKW